MARGNQRDKAREANQKKLAGMKGKNAQSGTEMARAKESAAEIMRKKQLACRSSQCLLAVGVDTDRSSGGQEG